MASEEGSITVPPEIITEILYRLPAKSVGRFRCVSKGWLSLLTDPQFIKIHTEKTLKQHHLIFLSNNHMLYSLPFHNNNQNGEKAVLEPIMVPFESGHIDFTFHASCNGLILMSARASDNGHNLVVINPTTTEYVELSEFGLNMLKGLRECESMYGFGYDSTTDDYKVVRVSDFYYNYVIPHVFMYVHVYSLRTDTWTWVIDSPDDHPYHYSYDGDMLPGVFTNGFLHWVARRHTDDLQVIVAFSLAHECFGELPLPESCIDNMYKNDCKLCVLVGKLAIFSQMKGEVWMMNEYGVKESWTKIILHGLNDIPMTKLMIFQDMDKILLACNSRIMIYDTEERRFSRNTEISRIQKLVVKGAYVESLFSPIPSRIN